MPGLGAFGDTPHPGFRHGNVCCAIRGSLWWNRWVHCLRLKKVSTCSGSSCGYGALNHGPRTLGWLCATNDQLICDVVNHFCIPTSWNECNRSFLKRGTPEPLVFQIDATIQLDDHLLEKHPRLADMSCLLAAHRFLMNHQKCTCCNLVLQHFHKFIDGFPLKYFSGKSKENPKSEAHHLAKCMVCGILHLFVAGTGQTDGQW